VKSSARAGTATIGGEAAGASTVGGEAALTVDGEAAGTATVGGETAGALTMIDWVLVFLLENGLNGYPRF
jgi:hypothetical protein